MSDYQKIEIAEIELMQAASEGMDAFLEVFTSKYNAFLGDEWTIEKMSLLNGHQMSLLVYSIFRTEVLDGGFVQLIHNGYGPLVFDNPFAKAMRLYGAHDFSKLVYKGKKLYDEHKKELTKSCSDEEFMALFEEFSKFDDLDDAFITSEEEITEILARYVDEHLDDFATIVK